jgi:hypothetical protein
LRSRLGSNPLQLVEPALQLQQLTLLDLRPALGLVSKLSEARFEAVGFLEFTDALCELTKTRIQIGDTAELIDPTLQALDLSQQLALRISDPRLTS